MTNQQPLYLRTDWYLNFSNYDLSDLHTDEISTIQSCLMQRSKRQNWFDIAHTKLARITQPLLDAIAPFEPKRQERNRLLALILEQQLRHQKVFWQWSPIQWSQAYDALLTAHKNGDSNIRINLFLQVSYVLAGYEKILYQDRGNPLKLASIVFAKTNFEENINSLIATLVTAGFKATWCQRWIPKAYALLCLANKSTDTNCLSSETIQLVRQNRNNIHWCRAFDRTLFALKQQGWLSPDITIQTMSNNKLIKGNARKGIHSLWLDHIDRYFDKSPQAPTTKKMHYHALLLLGRWVTEQYPNKVHPKDWTREMAVSCVAAIDRMTVGEWAVYRLKHNDTQPISAHTKNRYISAIRTFFSFLQEWSWIPRRFDPRRCFAIPRSIRSLIEPNPKPIDTPVWKKLIAATLNLSEDDLPFLKHRRYPIQMVKAIATTWLFSGLRPDEIRRLHTNCIRPAYGQDNTIYWLDVSTNKRNPAYTKPVDAALAHAIQEWEAIHTASDSHIDPKTGQSVQFLFTHNNLWIGKSYLASMVQFLCEIAGVPQEDSFGKITPNRARHTIAYQLANGRNPMPLLELQAWMGHRSPSSTLQYTTRTHLELSHAVQDYTQSNLRLATVLVDRDAIASGATMTGEPWKYYDLGHGYCTNDFFETCAHRIACARCLSYIPKDSGIPQLREAKQHLLTMREEIPLTNEMLTAIDEGVDAMNTLLEKLTDTPTPSGQTPRQLGTHNTRQLNIIALDDIPIHFSK